VLLFSAAAGGGGFRGDVAGTLRTGAAPGLALAGARGGGDGRGDADVDGDVPRAAAREYLLGRERLAAAEADALLAAADPQRRGRVPAPAMRALLARLGDRNGSKGDDGSDADIAAAAGAAAALAGGAEAGAGAGAGGPAAAAVLRREHHVEAISFVRSDSEAIGAIGPATHLLYATADGWVWPPPPAARRRGAPAHTNKGATSGGFGGPGAVVRRPRTRTKAPPRGALGARARL
jgi:hypothetical protein